jgi:hypothetical protein
MKIARILIDNVLGVRHADLRPQCPILFLSGDNGVGKSSLAECIRLALDREASTRVEHKKEYAQLVHETAKAGSVRVWTDVGQGWIEFPSGKASDDLMLDSIQSSALPYVLDHEMFLEASYDQRRVLLYELMAIDIGTEALVKRLRDRGCAADKVAIIAPYLKAGFESSQRNAANRATEAKGSFKTTTGGETWGKVKGESWQAPLPAMDLEEIGKQQLALSAEISETESKRSEAEQKLGIARHEKQKLDERAALIPMLREKAATLAQHADLVNLTQKNLTDAENQLAAARTAAGTRPPDPPKHYVCTSCSSILMDSGDGKHLVPYQETIQSSYDAEAAARIPALEQAVETYSKVLARHKANVDAAEEAALRLKDLEAAEQQVTEASELESIETLQKTVMSLNVTLTGARESQRELSRISDAAVSAAAKTKKAREHHVDVLSWQAIADALSPDGIPGELLAAALNPMNDRLRQSSADTEWKQVRIGPDMSITADGRPIKLLSKSEQWRCGVVIAEAIAHLSKLKFLLIDDMDILEPKQSGGRSQLLQWVDMLAAQDELDSCILIATLTSMPLIESPRFQSAWVDRGEITAMQRQPEEEAA